MNMITHGNYSHGLLPGTRYALGCASCTKARQEEETDNASGRWIVATGLPGYGPDASDGNFSIATSWRQLADVIADELDQLADFTYEGAEIAAGQEEYKEAWLTYKESEALGLLARTFSNDRQHAPLYRDNLPLWCETIERLIGENFPYDVSPSCRLYVWRDEEYGADEEEEGE